MLNGSTEVGPDLLCTGGDACACVSDLRSSWGPRLRLVPDLGRARTCVLKGLAGTVASGPSPPVPPKEIPHGL